METRPAWEIVKTVNQAQQNSARFKRMSRFPFEGEHKKLTRGHKRGDVTDFINEVKRIKKQAENCLMWHFKTSKEARRTHKTLTMRVYNDKSGDLKKMEFHIRKNKIYARWD
jgi:hypothetical protein